MSYENVDSEVVEMIKDLISRHHSELKDAKVKVKALFKHAPTDKNGEPRGSAIKLHGYPCWAIVEKTPLKWRGVGAPDALITIDGDRWPDLNDQRKQAIIDHELQHLEVLSDENGVETDDFGRPRLALRLHDYSLGGFDVIAMRYKQQSIEVANVAAFIDDHGQHHFPFTKKASAA